MDPISLATVTSAVAVLATEAIKGVASNVGKDLWERVKSLLGWKTDPNLGDLAIAVATRLEKDEALMAQIVSLLKTPSSSENTATALVRRLDATKAVVAQRLDVAGDFNM